MSDHQAAQGNAELDLRIEKLQLEIQELRRSTSRVGTVFRILTIAASIAPLVAILFTFEQFVIQQKAATDALKLQTERAFMQPVLQRQMDTYFDAASAAATIAGSNDLGARMKALDTFWRLYYGPLVMLESHEVSAAMKNFGYCLDHQGACTQIDIQNLSLALDSALQQDYFSSWNLNPTQYAARSISYVDRRKGEIPQPSKAQ